MTLSQGMGGGGQQQADALEGSVVVEAKARTGRKTGGKDKLQCVICCGHGHTSAQCPSWSLHSVDESER